MPERSEFMDRGPVAAAGEPNWVTWTYLFTELIPAEVNVFNQAYVNNRGTTYINSWWFAADVWQVTVADVVTLINPASIAQPWFGWDTFFVHPVSVNQRYLVALWGGVPNSFRVYDNDVLIFQRQVTLDDANITGCTHYTVSPDGRYIAFICDHAIAGAQHALVLYQGA